MNEKDLIFVSRKCYINNHVNLLLTEIRNGTLFLSKSLMNNHES